MYKRIKHQTSNINNRRSTGTCCFEDEDGEVPACPAARTTMSPPRFSEWTSASARAFTCGNSCPHSTSSSSHVNEITPSNYSSHQPTLHRQIWCLARLSLVPLHADSQGSSIRVYRYLALPPLVVQDQNNNNLHQATAMASSSVSLSPSLSLSSPFRPFEIASSRVSWMRRGIRSTSSASAADLNANFPDPEFTAA